MRNGEGTEYMSDGEFALYVGHFDNGMRSGEGTLYCDGYPEYIGEWKKGKKGWKGKEYDKNGNEERCQVCCLVFKIVFCILGIVLAVIYGGVGIAMFIGIIICCF